MCKYEFIKYVYTYKMVPFCVLYIRILSKILSRKNHASDIF